MYLLCWTQIRRGLELGDMMVGCGNGLLGEGLVLRDVVGCVVGTWRMLSRECVESW